MNPEQAPVWDKLKARFPAIDPKTIIVTYFPHVYCASDLDPDFQVHESVHLKQQEDYPGGPEAWWNEYLANPQFVKEQEAEAYRTQGKYLARFWKDRNARAIRLHKLALDLSGDIYGRIMSYEEAKRILNGN